MKEEVLTLLQNKQNVFLTGGAGVGKTTLTYAIIRHFESDAKKVAKLASTAMAATLFEGQTLHSFFDFGIASDVQTLEQNRKYPIPKKVKKLLQSIDLIVIDEISMVSSDVMEMIYLRLKQGEFGGVILLVGDFLQLPPVVRGGMQTYFAFESTAWKALALHTIELRHIYRTDDKAFIELLHKVRFGEIDEDAHNQLNSYIKPLPNELKDFTVLFGKNSSAMQHNKEQLESIEGEVITKEAQVVKHDSKINQEDIERFCSDARIELELHLKVGAPILFTQNSWNYYNGERGVVVNVDTEYLYIQKSDAKVIKLQQVKKSKTRWREKKSKEGVEMVEEEILSVYQYPVRLAFAITIHKSQGMSIENLVIHTHEIFASSQFYVALSRSSNPKNLILIAPRKQWYELAFTHPKALAFVQQGSVC